MRRQGVVAVLVTVIAIGVGTRRLWAMPGSHAAGSRTAQGYLGVDVRDLTPDEVTALKLKDAQGAEIIRLDHDGPACKAGVREHDVVLQLDGRPVEGQEQFRRTLHESVAGRTVTLLILRDGQQQVIRATMGNREEVERLAWQQHIAVVDPDVAPPPPPPAATPGGHVGGGGLGFLHGGSATAPTEGKSRSFLGTMLGAPYTGALVEPVGAQLGEFFGVPSGVGLLVKSVDAASPAASAGLHAGDVILKANQVAMSSESDWTKMLHENKGRALPVLVLRDRKEQTLMLTPDGRRRAQAQAERNAEAAMLGRMELQQED